MENLKQAVVYAQEIIDNNAVLAAKIEAGEPTKSTTAKLRKSMNELKKIVTPAKEELLNHDKAGK